MSPPFSLANNWESFSEYQRPVDWQTGPGREGICFVGRSEHSDWKIRINDFPDEPAYTLIIGTAEMLHFDVWPTFWISPESPTMVWN
jgi:hypothetical protein